MVGAAALGIIEKQYPLDQDVVMTTTAREIALVAVNVLVMMVPSLTVLVCFS